MRLMDGQTPADPTATLPLLQIIKRVRELKESIDWSDEFRRRANNIEEELTYMLPEDFYPTLGAMGLADGF